MTKIIRRTINTGEVDVIILNMVGSTVKRERHLRTSLEVQLTSPKMVEHGWGWWSRSGVPLQDINCIVSSRSLFPTVSPLSCIELVLFDQLYARRDVLMSKTGLFQGYSHGLALTLRMCGKWHKSSVLTTDSVKMCSYPKIFNPNIQNFTWELTTGAPRTRWTRGRTRRGHLTFEEKGRRLPAL
ncbi:hypothetical protein BDN70DRAFT_889510 [Pholiota conissans]|uniref:Uncharacterized protein n=1 Tax=Pholiota conissans TaxID=109636 RepID=A0A9P5ZGS1_9AGAR|nr:hypothetical protein BDN70DRAFT_889510 [Pholiota conissans]